MKILSYKSIFIGLALLYLLTRLSFLESLPIFNDESTYIRYGLHNIMEEHTAPYSLLIGKEPLLPLLYGLAGKLSGNLLLGARLVTVVFGLLTMAGLFNVATFLTIKLKRVTNTMPIAACLLYILTPYTLFFDRLALMDSPVSTVAIWSLYFTLKLIEKSTWKDALGLGGILGVGLWVKFSALFYIFLPLGCFLLLAYKRKEKIFDHNDFYKLFIVPLCVIAAIYIPLVSHEFYMEHLKLLDQYSYPLVSFFNFNIDIWMRNTSFVSHWLVFFLTPLISLLAFFGMWIYRKERVLWPVLVWFWLPLLYEILFAKLYTARHALSLVIPMLLFSALGLHVLLKQRKMVGHIVSGAIIVWTLYLDSVLLISPLQFPTVFPGATRSDLIPYVKGFSSGYGISEAVTYLKQQAANGPITIFIRNDHGNPEDAIVAYFSYQALYQVVPLNDASRVAEMLKNNQQPAYFVSRGGYNGGFDAYFTGEGKKFLKPNDEEFVGVYRLR